jgi:carbonic anhydrase/acetyltransferase-like protein (isoleucine patch superfamily)
MPIIKPYKGNIPDVSGASFIAENATLVGRVVLGANANVWYGVVLRGDVGFIRIGASTNIQDLACIHATLGMSNTEIGAEVTVGHGAIIHGATIRDGALIGMGSVILDNAEIGEECLVAAGTVVTPRTIIPPRSLVRGQPGKVIRPLRDDEWPMGRLSAAHYVELSAEHRV